MTLKSDAHKRIFLTRSALSGSTESDLVSLALTFIHEVSHLEYKTHDLYYFNAPKSSASLEQYWEGINEQVWSLIRPSKLDNVLVENIEGLSRRELESAFGTSDTNEIQRNFPRYKARALRVNADSLAAAVALYSLPGLQQRMLKNASVRPSHRREPTPDYN